MKTDQIEMINVKQLMLEKQTYRKLKKLLSFDQNQLSTSGQTL